MPPWLNGLGRHLLNVEAMEFLNLLRSGFDSYWGYQNNKKGEIVGLFSRQMPIVERQDDDDDIMAEIGSGIDEAGVIQYLREVTRDKYDEIKQIVDIQRKADEDIAIVRAGSKRKYQQQLKEQKAQQEQAEAQQHADQVADDELDAISDLLADEDNNNDNDIK